jgi:MGT family glycosyltransferase
VTVVARAKAAPLAEQLGLPLHELETDDVPYPSGYLLWLIFAAFGASCNIGMRQAIQWDAEVVLRQVPAVLEELAVDGVLIDQSLAAGGTAAERIGLPFVTICSALLWHEEVGLPPPFTPWRYAQGWRARLRNRLGYAAWHWFMRPAMKAINRQRKAWRLPPLARVNDLFSPLAQISQLCAEFDFPRQELLPYFHYIGSFAASRRVNTDHQFPWDRLDGRPLIFASLGTVPDPPNLPVFRKILAACAGLDVQLVLALGRWHEEQESVREKLGPVPDNALVVEFAPQLALLERAAVMITHAGLNTTLESLSRGVPLVALPRSADQPGNASRIERAGAGLRTSFLHSTPEELRRLVERVLTEETFRRKARELRQALLAAGGARRAAEIAEQALTTGRPVLRQ